MLINKYPMKLRSVPKEIIWGGDKLKQSYGKTASFDKIAESWELTVREDGMSIIENGEYKGTSLENYISQDFVGTVGSSADTNSFPLLIKFIDASDNLSVQVHPNNEYALSWEGESGKTEMWYVVQADEGAELVYGLREGVSRSLFEEAIKNETTNETLRRIRVRAGDVYFIPSGQVHAICKGAFIAEIQQNSNITYRIYDYDRIDANGKKRELHINKALDSIKFYTNDEILALRFEGSVKRQPPKEPADVLCDCKYFRVSKFNLNGRLKLYADEKSFLSLLFTETSGKSEVTSNGISVSVNGGDSVFVPAGSGDVTVTGHGKFLLSEI